LNAGYGLGLVDAGASHGKIFGFESHHLICGKGALGMMDVGQLTSDESALCLLLINALPHLFQIDSPSRVLQCRRLELPAIYDCLPLRGVRARELESGARITAAPYVAVAESLTEVGTGLDPVFDSSIFPFLL
jgi:hypothetical protein